MNKKKIIIIVSLFVVLGIIIYVRLFSDVKEDGNFEISRFETEQTFSGKDYVAAKDWCIRCDNRRLILTSLKTGNSNMLCFDASCKHNQTECIADISIMEKVNAMYVYMNELYIVDLTRNQLDVYAVDLEKSERTVCTRIPLGGIGTNASCMAKDGKIYAIVSFKDPEYKEYIGSNHQVGSSMIISRIYEIDLENGKYQLLAEIDKNYDSYLLLDKITDESIGFTNHYYTMPQEKIYDIETLEALVDNPKEYEKNEYWSYNTKTKEIVKQDGYGTLRINSDKEYDYFVDGKNKAVYAYKGDEESYEVDLEYFPEHENWLMLAHINGWSFMYELLPDGTYVDIFDKDGKVVQKINLQDMAISSVCEGGVFVNTSGIPSFTPDAIIPMDDFLKAMEDRDFSDIKSKAVRFKDVS